MFVIGEPAETGPDASLANALCAIEHATRHSSPTRTASFFVLSSPRQQRPLVFPHLFLPKSPSSRLQAMVVKHVNLSRGATLLMRCSRSSCLPTAAALQSASGGATSGGRQAVTCTAANQRSAVRELQPRRRCQCWNH